MQTLNNVKNDLIQLGLLQGFDLTNPKVSEYTDPETEELRWFSEYSPEYNWDNELQEGLNNFLQYMHEYHDNIVKNNLMQASNALCMAMIHAGNLSLYFDAIKSDISTLLTAKYSTNNFTWPQAD